MAKLALVTGGSGFLGRHVCLALLCQGYTVLSLDNRSGANARLNMGPLDLPLQYPGNRPHDDTRFIDRYGDLSCVDARYIESTVRKVEQKTSTDLVEIWHLASLASPREYKANAIATLRLGTQTLDQLCELASRSFVPLMFASTSEVYGDPIYPEGKPQPIPEDYFGNVSTTGPRSMYDEAKRCGEAICAAWAEQGVDVKIPRIFNTYGPGMSPYDGRLVSTLINCALSGEPFSVHGTGEQTRTLCFVTDLLSQLMFVRDRGATGVPVNVGGRMEDWVSVNGLVAAVSQALGVEVRTTHAPPQDRHDPKSRCPDLRMIENWGWEGHDVTLQEGIAATAVWMREFCGGR